MSWICNIMDHLTGSGPNKRSFTFGEQVCLPGYLYRTTVLHYTAVCPHIFLYQMQLLLILQLYLKKTHPHQQGCMDIASAYFCHCRVWHSHHYSRTLHMFIQRWSAYCFSACIGLKCLCLCLCVCVLQSKWPFGKASRVIIVNYSVKLRVLLRGKQSEWAIFNSTSCESSLDSKQTSLTDPGCSQRTQACWVRK